MVNYPAGTILGECILGIDAAELVQSGGQGAVYKATLEGKTVALKLIALDPDETAAEQLGTDVSVVVERAQREVAILEQVDVPVLARLGPLGLSTIQVGEECWIYFTEEWIEGQTLRDMILEDRLSPEQVVKLGVDLVQAVCWLSRRGLVHRDIKPSNVMWAVDRSRFVLLDPGIAFDLQGPSLTRIPVPVGTMAYLSPEQMDPSRKRTLDFRSDLFAIGIVMYEASAGEHPFMSIDTTPGQILAGILSATPQTLTDRIQGFPPTLSALISRLLGKAPHLRYRTCEHARMAIEETATSLGVKA